MPASYIPAEARRGGSGSGKRTIFALAAATEAATSERQQPQRGKKGKSFTQRENKNETKNKRALTLNQNRAKYELLWRAETRVVFGKFGHRCELGSPCSLYLMVSLSGFRRGHSCH
jgi:hypothetical protein